MAPDAFVERIRSEVEHLALLYAGMPDEIVEASLKDFGERVLVQWREVFSLLKPDDVAGMVEDLLGRIRARRREIEVGGRGLA